MILTQKTIDKAGMTSDKLKAKFYPKEGEAARSKKIQDFVRLIDTRVQAGVDQCLTMGETYHAIDRMLRTPSYQVTRSTISHLIDVSERAPDEAARMLNDLGLTRLLTPEMDPVTGAPKVDSDGNTVMALHLPTFSEVLVPIVLGYFQAKWASLFDAVDLTPLYKYPPSVPTPENKALCSILTSVIDRWTTGMGYRADERQSVMQAVAYGWCLNLPMGGFFRMYSGIGSDRELVKEGVRWAIPHPSKCFIDMAHRPSTINSDTGCSWYGYWDLVRWGEVAQDRSLWLTTDENGSPSLRLSNLSTGLPSIFCGSTYRAYQALYPCTMKFPWGSSDAATRSEKAFEYTREQYDYGIALCTTYHLVVPSQFDLGDYDEPTWFQVTTAFGDQPLSVLPMKHGAGVLYQFDADQNATDPIGLPLQVAPFGDLVTNQLRQYVLSVRRNLTNLVFYNKDGVSVDIVRRLEFLGQKTTYGSLEFVGMSGRSLETKGLHMGNLFESVQFPMVDTGAVLAGVASSLSLMERVLQISPNEVGASYSHQVSATEAAKTSAAGNVRKSFSLGFIEDGIHRKSEILYEALMTEGDDEIFAEVSDTLGIPIPVLEKLGFKVEAGDQTKRSFGVVGPKSALSAADFSTNQQGSRRPSDAMLAQEMMRTMQVVFASKPLIEAAGVDTLVGWWNTIAEYAGMPTNIRIRSDGAQPQMTPEQLMEAVIPAIQQATQQQIAQLAEAIKNNEIEPLRMEIAKAIEAVVARVSRVEGAAQLPPAQGAIVPA